MQHCDYLIIGAGIAGLACARVLRDHGISVVIFDEGPGLGGRLWGREIGGEDQRLSGSAAVKAAT